MTKKRKGMVELSKEGGMDSGQPKSQVFTSVPLTSRVSPRKFFNCFSTERQFSRHVWFPTRLFQLVVIKGERWRQEQAWKGTGTQGQRSERRRMRLLEWGLCYPTWSSSLPQTERPTNAGTAYRVFTVLFQMETHQAKLPPLFAQWSFSPSTLLIQT